MKLRNTFLMALVLVVLAGFVYFYEIRGREGREEAERVEGLLLDFDADAVTSVTLETSEGAFELNRIEDGWRIIQPYELNADESTVNSLLSQLESASLERLVVEEPEDLAPFGLDEPAVRVALVLEDGDSLGLRIGGGTPVGYNVYAIRGEEPAVLMTPASLKDTLDKSLFDLRDKSILAFEDDDVEGVDIATESFQVSLRREPEVEERVGGPRRWRITAPSEARASGDEVSTTLRRLRTDQATAFVTEQPTDEEMAAFGLAEPRYRLTVWTTGDASQTIEIGAESGDPEGVFARRLGSEPVFVIPQSLVDAIIPESLDDLRDPTFVDLERDRVTALELESGAGRYRVDRQGTEWHISTPRDLEADASRVSSVLSALINLSADGFAAGTADDQSYGFAEPSLTVTAHLDEGDPVVLRVGDTTEIVDDAAAPAAPEDEEAQEPVTVTARYASIAGDPTVYVVRDSALELLRSDLFSLRAKTLLTFAQEELTRIEVVTDGALYDLEKRGDGWFRTGQQDGQIEATRISDLLWNLNYLRMEAVATEWDETATPPDLAPFGLDSPDLRITAYVADQVVGDVRIGSAVPAEMIEDRAETAPAGQIYVLVGDAPAVYQVGSRLRDALASLAGELAGS